MEYTYKTKGTCSRSITFDIDDNNVVTSIKFEGGCNGNLKGISALCEGMKAEDIIARVQNLTCGMKNTSCPDQLSCALKEYLAKKGE